MGVQEGLTPFLGIGSAVLYGTVAVAMNFVNKFTMQVYPLSNVVMVSQMLVTWALLQALLMLRQLDFPRFTWTKCRQLFWITVMYTLNTAFALFGLKTLNVPMYNTLKRLTPIIVLGCKAVVTRRMPATQITASVLLVVLGCIVAGVGDLTFELYGYVFAFLSCLAQAAYLLLVEFQGAGGIPTSEMLYYNSITSLPLLGVIVLITDEASHMIPRYHESVAEYGLVVFWSTIMTCALMGCLLNYALFLCTANNSALTTTIVGVLKSVVAVLLGFFLLGGVPFSLVNVSGITLNTVGGIWYSLYKFTEKSRRRSLPGAVSPGKASSSGSHAHFNDHGLSHSTSGLDLEVPESKPLLSGGEGAVPRRTNHGQNGYSSSPPR
mmetsp:Transcript_12864/g.27782  ORF Transcript_12864/g.27782 Transcript_12864/m.27782 type:complete len:379 (+) Transcript_12864:240-1376(+)|eukprot:CAMPEP_0202903518 /NCGR_PEP_ID=MMETSP1392-20130828/24890_1 /ASSEMBLY_ACC=CAM_ASM_000868 /TAXON_ID=225041 /ORGANISM="Chlamydomonas chlamydogama, Strain SAG 11-48b" /LENGTH=378 /DNA_ID=CAMNT_0049590741 /DNA_START=169 /DNA_END=1305 /DNA_ORIENTATION=+